MLVSTSARRRLANAVMATACPKLRCESIKFQTISIKNLQSIEDQGRDDEVSSEVGCQAGEDNFGRKKVELEHLSKHLHKLSSMETKMSSMYIFDGCGLAHITKVTRSPRELERLSTCISATARVMQIVFN